MTAASQDLCGCTWKDYYALREIISMSQRDENIKVTSASNEQQKPRALNYMFWMFIISQTPFDSQVG
jgi:hypothetical protein